MNAWLKALLTLAAAFVIVIGGIVLFIIGQIAWQDVTRGIETAETVNIDPADESIVERLFLSDFERIGPEATVYAKLYLSQDFDSGLGSSYSSESSYRNVLNMVFVTPGSPGRWLFPTNDQLITRTEKVALAPLSGNTQDQPAAGMLLLLVPSDTNNDKRLSDKDVTDLALVRPDGLGLTILQSDVKDQARIVPDADNIVLGLKTDNGVEILRLDPTTFAVLGRQTIDFPK